MSFNHLSFQQSQLRSGGYNLLAMLLLSAVLLLSPLTSIPVAAAEQAATTDQTATEALGALSDDEITVVSYPPSEFKDPLIGFNRAMFAFNDISYRYVLIPVAKGYNAVAPQPVRTGVSNIFANIKAPIHIINHILQGQPSKAGTTSARFLLNTTVGVAGIFDPASSWFDLPIEETGFSETLTQYGSGYGVYLVLPFIGASDLRGGTGEVVDYFLNPIPYITEQPDTTLIMASDTLQAFAPHAESYLRLREESDDPYLFFRNMHLQGLLRDKQFKPDASQRQATQQ